MNEWIPTPPQQLALESICYEIGFGGGRGGGKTETGLAWLMYDKDHPLLRARIIRKLAEDLKDWVDRAERFYNPFGAEKRGNPGDFYWPKGAVFRAT